MKEICLYLGGIWQFVAGICLLALSGCWPKEQPEPLHEPKVVAIRTMLTDTEAEEIASAAFETWAMNHVDDYTRDKIVELYRIIGDDGVTIAQKRYTTDVFMRIIDVKVSYLDNASPGGLTIDRPDRQLVEFEELIGNRVVKDIKLTLQDGEWKIKEVIFAAPERRG